MDIIVRVMATSLVGFLVSMIALSPIDTDRDITVVAGFFIALLLISSVVFFISLIALIWY